MILQAATRIMTEKMLKLYICIIKNQKTTGY